MEHKKTRLTGPPPKQGLYDPAFEHDACGVGFIVDIHGRKSHQIVSDALTILLNLDHRGAVGSEHNTGDGAGILTQMPDIFLRRVCAEQGIALPELGHYGAGVVFTSPEESEAKAARETFEKLAAAQGLSILGWRELPTDNSMLGATALASEPRLLQVFLERPATCAEVLDFERQLYIVRKSAHHAIRASDMDPVWYVPSLSSRTMIYKGMLMPEQVDKYFLDLLAPDYESAIGLVHSRFSTNTFPSWDRSHPYRFIAHNGEINTLRGNVNWMHAREAQLSSKVFGDDIKKILPVINTNGSDSSMFDNCLELLVLAGRPLPHAVMMMIPEPWELNENMPDDKRAFYEFHSCLMEPWDGPASVAFTDGTVIGATLDRNGLRPSRYWVTKDGLVIMASETGVLPIEPERILEKGRLQPGRMFLVDTSKGRIISDEEIKNEIVHENPYRKWLDENHILLADLPKAQSEWIPDHATILQRQQAFGYTFEDQRVIIGPMARDGVQPIGSMGTDTPLAVLSDKPVLLYNYFKQLFAQVTNPPIDPIREEIVTATTTMLGSEGNLLEPTPTSCRMIKLDEPLIDNAALEQIRTLVHPAFRPVTLPILFDAAAGPEGLEAAMATLFADADKALAEGKNILILSDRGMDKDHVAIPALLAVAGLHHHLIRNGTRTKASLVLESGEPREVHHFALLLGYGISAINPYLAFESLDDMIQQGMLPGVDHKKAVKNFIKAAVKGVVKTMAKMGISTIKSYRGAQIFEAVGLNREVVDKYFCWTPSRVEGIGLSAIGAELFRRHRRAYPLGEVVNPTLDPGGDYQWRSDGEQHLFNPETIHSLQKAVRTDDYATFKKYSALVNEQDKHHFTLRGMLQFKKATPVPIEEVETVEQIVRRFKTGAMSYGSISKEAHEALAIAMNRIGGKSNTGEGGEDPERFTWSENGDSMNSAIKQVASGRFGVNAHYLTNAREIQIKMAQGAKPGEGGELPGTKVYPSIAKTRGTTPGVGLISPPPHHDIYSIEDLAELIHDLKNANRAARISVKLVSEVGVGTIAAGVAKAHADVVLISGFDGGTGASPLSSIKHAGMPWELGLAETHQTLVLNNLRSRIAVETDGQLKTGRDVAIAALLGAEEFGFATAPLVTLGCIMMRVCHKNTCPVGVASQNPELRKNFTGDPAHTVNFMRFIAQEVREIMAELGFRTINEMVGRVDKLEARKAVDHWKARGLDLSALLYSPPVGPEVGRHCQLTQDHGIAKSLDMTVLMDICKPAIERGEKVRATLPVKNINRVLGTIIGNEVTRKYGAAGLPEDTIHLHFQGSSGQSLGAFMPHGMTIELEGDTNDYLGKGLSGGRIIVYPPKASTFKAEENIICGNVALYGATKGEVFLSGMAGERFGVRNSGVNAVVEGLGDHGCEYMTGGRVVVLGETGRNFAAGMSGGIAYILDQAGDFGAIRCNKAMVGLEKLEDPAEIEELRELIARHVEYTGSERGKAVLADWETLLPKFVKVIPHDYKRVLEAIAQAKADGLDGDEAINAAFEANSRDLSRVGGN